MRRCSRFVAAPLHAFALPRTRASTEIQPAHPDAPPPPRDAPRERRDLSSRARGLRRLLVRAVRTVGASAGDLSARRDRAAARGHDRHAVRARAGRGAAVRVHFRAQHPSAHDGALCGRHAGRIVRLPLAVRIFYAGRGAVRRDVRRRQRAYHHRARRGAARAVRGGGLRAHHRPHRRAGADRHGGRAAGGRVRRRTRIRSGRTRRRGGLRGRLLCLFPAGAHASSKSCRAPEMRRACARAPRAQGARRRPSGAPAHRRNRISAPA